MEIFQIRKDALGLLLSHITSVYLSQFYCICVYWHSIEFEQTINEFLNYSSKSSSAYVGDRNNINSSISNFQLFSFKYVTNNSAEIFELHLNSGCQAFIVTMDIALEFLHLYSTVVPKCKQRFPKNHFVFVPTSNIKSDETHNILKHPAILDVPNILIITMHEVKYTKGNDKYDENTFDLITSQFVGRFNNTSAILLDTFYGRNATFKQNANLFPDKLSNLEQRVVRLALFNYKPYTVWKEVPSGLGNANAMQTDEEKTLLIDGTESLLLLEFCSKHNCTLEIALGSDYNQHIRILISNYFELIWNDVNPVSKNEKSNFTFFGIELTIESPPGRKVRGSLTPCTKYDAEWGEIYENGTGIGILGAVAERRADVGISALYAWYDVFQYLDFSTPITRTGITCIVPKPRPIIGWLLPAQPFSWQLWLAMLITFFVGTIGLIWTDFIECKLKIQKINNNAMARVFFDVLTIYLFQPTRIIIVNKVAKMIILGCIILIGMLMGNAYSGGLASIMSVPLYEVPIDTVHQLAEKHMEWGATHDAWIFSILQATQPDIIKVLQLFRALPYENLKKRTTTHNFGFSIERLPYGHYAIGEYISIDSIKNLQIMHNDIYYEYALAQSYKTWPLLPNLNTLTMEIVQSGIQKYWELQVCMKHCDNNVQLGVATSRGSHESHGTVALHLSHVMGAFIIWFIGLVVSTVVFVAENFLWNK